MSCIINPQVDVTDSILLKRYTTMQKIIEKHIEIERLSYELHELKLSYKIEYCVSYHSNDCNASLMSE